MMEEHIKNYIKSINHILDGKGFNTKMYGVHVCNKMILEGILIIILILLERKK